MTSVTSSYDTRLTNEFVTEDTTYIFLPSDIQSWFSLNQHLVQQLGSLYVVRGSQFVIGGKINPGYGELNSTASTIPSNVILRDLGKEIRIGWIKNQVNESSLLVLRYVQLIGDSMHNGIPTDPRSVGYVLIENNTTDLTNSKYSVTVTRV